MKKPTYDADRVNTIRAGIHSLFATEAEINRRVSRIDLEFWSRTLLKAPDLLVEAMIAFAAAVRTEAAFVDDFDALTDPTTRQFRQGMNTPASYRILEKEERHWLNCKREFIEAVKLASPGEWDTMQRLRRAAANMRALGRILDRQLSIQQATQLAEGNLSSAACRLPVPATVEPVLFFYAEEDEDVYREFEAFLRVWEISTINWTRLPISHLSTWIHSKSRTAARIVFLCSQHYIRSSFMPEETEAALKVEREDGPGVILVVALEGTDAVPQTLPTWRMFQYPVRQRGRSSPRIRHNARRDLLIRLNVRLPTEDVFVSTLYQGSRIGKRRIVVVTDGSNDVVVIVNTIKLHGIEVTVITPETRTAKIENDVVLVVSVAARLSPEQFARFGWSGLPVVYFRSERGLEALLEDIAFELNARGAKTRLSSG